MCFCSCNIQTNDVQAHGSGLKPLSEDFYFHPQYGTIKTTRAQPSVREMLGGTWQFPFATSSFLRLYPETPSAICTPVGCRRIHASASGDTNLVSVLEPRHRRHRERREAILTEILHEKLRWLGWHMRPWQKRHVVPLAMWFGGFMKGEAGMRVGSCSMRGFNEQNVLSTINILPSSRLVPHSQWRPPSFIKSSAFPPLSGPLLLRHDWRGGRVGNTDADQTPPDAKDTRRLCRSQGPLCVCVCVCVYKGVYVYRRRLYAT